MKRTSIFRNTWLNLIGQGLPLVLSVVLLPGLMERIGKQRLGVLTTIWVVLGYFVLLDLGLGRAIVHLVADSLGKNQHDKISEYVWPAVILMSLASGIGAAVLSASSTAIVGRLFNIPPELRNETISAFVAIACSLPAVTLISCFRALLEAREKFLSANVLASLSSGTNVAVPFLVALKTPKLSVMAWWLLAARVLVLIFQVGFVLKEFPELRRAFVWEKSSFRRLFSFGLWSSLTNIVGPLMVYSDRIIVSAKLEVGILPSYAIPQDVVSRLLILPAAFVRALFPRMSALGAVQPAEHIRLNRQSVRLLSLGVFPIAAVLIYMGKEVFSLWLGPDIAKGAAPVLQILAIGYFLNCLAQVPFIALQSQERPDLSALTHLVELPLYLLFLWWATTRWGIRGAALLWTLRVMVDTLALFFWSGFVRGSSFLSELRHNWGVAAGFVLLLPGFFLSAFGARTIALGLSVPVFSFLCWQFLLDRETKSRLIQIARRS